MYKVCVKWGKNKYDDVELNTDESVELFKAQLFALTSVPTDRQKIMIPKGGMLKDEWNKSLFKEGIVLTLLGSADEIKGPEGKVVFMEDLPPSQQQAMASYGMPPGLKNLENTCYLNATLQCLKTVSPMKNALRKYKATASPANDGAAKVTNAMRTLYLMMEKSQPSVLPIDFVNTFRSSYPQFSQMDTAGHFKQQDAEECLSQILTALGDKLPIEKEDITATTTTTDASASTTAQANPDAMAIDTVEDKDKDKKFDTRLLQPKSFVHQAFALELSSKFKCLENDAEPQREVKEIALKLVCHITQQIGILEEGLRQAFVTNPDEPIMKTSESLGREAKYQKISQINTLPPYLIIQFMRFYWKQQKGVKAKIVKTAKFPFTLDVYDYCTDSLKEKIKNNRDRVRGAILSSKEKTKETSEKGKGQEKEDTAISTLSDEVGLKNEFGLYELTAVLTHIGQSADSGHYVAWVRKQGDEWFKFDDDKVTPVSSEEIKKLVGGGDWHIAYICIYRSKTPKEVASHFHY